MMHCMHSDGVYTTCRYWSRISSEYRANPLKRSYFKDALHILNLPKMPHRRSNEARTLSPDASYHGPEENVREGGTPSLRKEKKRNIGHEVMHQAETSPYSTL